MKTISLGPNQRPIWSRGSAFVDGGDIVLRREDAEDYAFFEEDRLEELLLNVVGLRHMGSLGDPSELDPQPALSFVRRHGLLWHGPEQLARGECREPLSSWYFQGEEFMLSVAIYMTIRDSLDTDSTAPLREYLRLQRDYGIFWGAMPTDPQELLEGLSIILAERINGGMENCNQTFLAACGLQRDGVKVGPAGDFRYSVNPGNLVAAANDQLASLIVTKKRFKECKGCGQVFQVEHGNGSYCARACSERTRKRRQRAKSAS